MFLFEKIKVKQNEALKSSSMRVKYIITLSLSLTLKFSCLKILLFFVFKGTNFNMKTDTKSIKLI